MRVNVEVYGCATTQAEGSSIRALAENAGHELVDSVDEADAVVLVTCTVVERTQITMERRLRELQELTGTLVVTGCMASAQPEAVL
ncbi:MAG: tRNA modifying enzyme, partial [Candidatus Thermoplasmatota archaeon]|nr:tRNA modifying enzyme [Candidatus Thermoplasmatota archaeon]